MLKIKDFSVERKNGCLVLDDKSPRFSWKIISNNDNVKQISYRLKVFGKQLAYDSAAKKTEHSIFIGFDGQLLPQSEYTAQIEVTDNYGEKAVANLSFETGLMGNFPGEFIAPIIDPQLDVSVICKTVVIKKKIKKARLYATALGMYNVNINNQKVGDLFFAPFWTSYNKLLQYQAYDVTNHIIQGNNSVDMLLAKGWYRGRIGFENKSNHYGSTSAGWILLWLEYEDGSIEKVVTDSDWNSRSSTIIKSELYDGEICDFTTDCSKVFGVRTIQFEKSVMTAQINEPVRVTEEIKPISIQKAIGGQHILDFGQNLTGLIKLNINGKYGQKIILRHAEVLDKEGNLYTENLRSAKATDVFVLCGGEQTICASFTFHGFRYAAIDGIDNLDCKDISALVIHSDMQKCGTVTTDNKRINQLMKNVVWGQRGNFVDVPTDCPQRDERLGWLGDANVFAGTAMLNYNTAAFFSKWLQDIRNDQRDDGGVPSVVPDVIKTEYNVSLWADCFPTIAWLGYERYGDMHFLSDNILSMCKYLESMLSNCNDSGLIDKGFQYADWLALDNDEMLAKTGFGATDKYFVANVFYLNSLDILRKAADVLSDNEQSEKYKIRHQKVLHAFRNEYFTCSGRIVNETQTALSLVLHFNIAEKKFTDDINKRLCENIKLHENHLTTGFAGTPFLCFALTDFGGHETATQLLFQRNYPGWMYAIDKGATTIWERWNGIAPNGDFYNPSMNSFNHYSYGSIAEFVYKRIAGLNAIEPGYKKIRIAPTLTKGITNICVQYESAYGAIVSGYTINGNNVKIIAEIPPNTTAEIVLPNGDVFVKGSGKHEFSFTTDMNFALEGVTPDITLGEIQGSEILKCILNSVSNNMFESPRLAAASGLTLGKIATLLGENGAEIIRQILIAANAKLSEMDKVETVF